MEPGEFTPLLAALALPPGGPLLLALLGLLMVRRWLGRGLLVLGVGSLWLLSCNAVAVLLAGWLLPAVPAMLPDRLTGPQVQAIVVLGGGVLPESAEYGQAQPSAETLARLRYGVWLARQSGKPLAFTGGVGWASASDVAAESEVAQRVLKQEYGIVLRWAEGKSRDTRENALQLRLPMQRDRIEHIALVTHAAHMPRAMLEFQRVGFEVTPAPIGFAAARERSLLEWLPSAHGLAGSREAVRQWVSLRLTQL